MDTRGSILLIDDDRAWLDTLAEYLQDKGYPVEKAHGGIHGLKLLDRLDVSVAVIDFRMPGMNGIELLRQMRRKRSNLGVLLLSSEDDPALPTLALAEGAKAFLSKNSPPRQLLHLLNETLAIYGYGDARPSPDRLLPVVRPNRRTLPVPVVFYGRFPLLGF